MWVCTQDMATSLAGFEVSILHDFTEERICMACNAETIAFLLGPKAPSHKMGSFCF